MRRAWLLIPLLFACGKRRDADRPPPAETENEAPSTGDPAAGDPAAAAADSAPKSAAQMFPHAATRGDAACEDAVLHAENGVEVGWLCRADAVKLGLTLIDLSEKWAPTPFGPAEGMQPKFRETYLLLAAGIDPDGGELAPEERLVEMYGVTPAPSVVLGRFRDEKRHACHAAIDREVFKVDMKTVKEQSSKAASGTNNKRKYAEERLEKIRKKKGLPDLAAVGALKEYRSEYAAWKKLDAQYRAVKAAQETMVCDGLMSRRDVNGKFDDDSSEKLDFWQRNNFLLPHGDLDADTREAMAAGSIELDYRAALRLLRERVVDATGLIEDGSAGVGPQTVMGRQLEPAVMEHAKGHEPLPNAAPDLIGASTEAAAKALGWSSPEAVETFLAAHAGEQLLVALPLPPPPRYHSAHMELRAEIDPADFGKPGRRPALTLFAKDGDQELALVTWPTTIGGWHDEVQEDGTIGEVYKASDFGPRVWKQLYVAPTWNPPETTPDDELVRYHGNGKYRLKKEVFGPGPRAAYGMVMLINHQPYQKNGETRYHDNGIRVHGSSSVTSVIRGASHGCHRLLNHLAVRLGSFLLRHRNHEVKGDQRNGYQRTVLIKDQELTFRNETRGFLYELTPPVEIVVLPGKKGSKEVRNIRAPKGEELPPADAPIAEGEVPVEERIDL